MNRSFPRDTRSPRQARRFVTEALRHLDADLLADLALMVSELATNAVRHAASGFDVRIIEGPDTVCVEVTDHGDGRPVLRRPGADEATGRGLLIVEQLAEHWGIEMLPAGKTVRFCKALP